MALATAKGEASVAYDGVVAVGEGADEFVGVGTDGSGAYLLRGVGVGPEGYVCGYGVVEEYAIVSWCPSIRMLPSETS